MFSAALLNDYLNDEYHDSILATLGKKGDYDRGGYFDKGLVDITRMLTPFLDSGKGNWSRQLMDASEDLLSAVEAAVVDADGTEWVRGNGGLSINMPLVPIGKMYAGRTADGDAAYNYSYRADIVIKLYDLLGSSINEDYKKTYSQIALNKIAAMDIGDSWLKDRITTQNVVDNLLGRTQRGLSY